MSFFNVCLNKQSRPKFVPLVEPEVDNVKPFKQTKQCFKRSPMKNQHKLLTCSCLCTLKY